MLLVRAPVRISLAGGGTDLPSYYEHFGGLVVNAAIARYFYVFLNPTGDQGVQISSSDFSAFSRWSAGEEPLSDEILRLPRAVLHDFGAAGGFSIFLASEIPPGTGLGSSSTVAVALTKAISTYLGQRLSPAEIAERASSIEIDKLASPIGKQDQYAAAFGGLNVLTFESNGVQVEPLALEPEVRRRLEGNLLLFYTGLSRSANAILREQRQSTTNRQAHVLEALHDIKSFARETRAVLEAANLDGLGEILHQSWQAKRRLAHGITNWRIDTLYDRARERGALGGKITGAGGGGFLLLYCRRSAQPDVCEEMTKQGLYRMDFRFDGGGAKVLLNSATRPPAEPSGVMLPGAVSE
jgi:D-glycero-alpha-D-manno-heptose-7-phosphate kinase